MDSRISDRSLIPMLRADPTETEQDAVDQIFDARIKRAVAVLQALLAYYRVKKVPTSATRQRIEIEDAALAVATGGVGLADGAVRLASRGSDRTPAGKLLAGGGGCPAR